MRGCPSPPHQSRSCCALHEPASPQRGSLPHTISPPSLPPGGKVSPQVTDEGGVSPEASGTLSTSSVSLKDFIFTWEISRQRYFGGRHASLRSAHTASCPAPPRGSLCPPKVPKAFHPPNARFHDTPSIGELQSSTHKKDRAKSPVWKKPFFVDVPGCAKHTIIRDRIEIWSTISRPQK